MHKGHRALRVGESVRRALGCLLLEQGVTVTEVRMSPDLRCACVFVISLGGGDCVASMEADRARLRHALASSLSLRYAPSLRFRYDDSFDRYEKIDSLLRAPQVAKDIGSRA